MFESGEEIEDKMHKFKYDIEKETGIPWKKKKSYRYLYTLACQKGVILRAFTITDLLEYIPNERKTTGKYLILEEHGNRKQKKEKD